MAVRTVNRPWGEPVKSSMTARRAARPGVIALTLILAVVLATPPAQAAAPPIDLPGLVSQTPATYTPNMVRGPFPGDLTTQIWGYVPMSGVMYACGDFAQVRSSDNQTTLDRKNLFAFDPMTGVISDFAPDVNGPVYTCAASPDGRSIYIGGDFTAVNGLPALDLARIDTSTGQLIPTFQASTDQPVTDLAVVQNRLLVSGSFSTVSGQPHRAMATVDLETGAFDPYLALDIEGQVAPNSGLTRVYRFAVNAGQTQGVAIGNFTSVDGVSHSGAFRFDLGATPRLVDWDNPDFHLLCGPEFDMPVWSRDVQFAPRGQFFVIVGTGGRGGGLCDTTSRWETSGRGSDVQPTWVNRTCTDTLHSVAVTQHVVYVQGHQKCVMGKNGLEVPRYGIAALSAGTGYALNWRSDQTRAVGGRYLMITNSATQPGFPSGLWAGCDCMSEGGVIFRPYS